MQYRYAPERSYEDLAAGRVLLHRGGMPCFPVRAGSEILSRCLAACPKQRGLTLYDPCCGGGYLLTALGFLYPGVLGRIIGSDVSPQALSLARDNLALLTPEGRARRREQLREMAARFGKDSHRGALESLARLEAAAPCPPPETRLFTADLLGPAPLAGAGFTADILLADVPYGRMTAWAGGVLEPGGGDGGEACQEPPLTRFLRAVRPACGRGTVLAVIADKGQKLSGGGLAYLDKFTIGKRRVSIFRFKDGEEEELVC